MGNGNYIYLLFTRSDTLMSRAVYWFTRDKYTHVSISTDESLSDFYSFGRRVPCRMLPAGFTKESLNAGLYRMNGAMPCRLVRIETKQSEVERIRTILDFFYRYRFQYKYSILGTIFCRLGIRYQRIQHRFCSQFVSELLQECSIMREDREPSRSSVRLSWPGSRMPTRSSRETSKASGGGSRRLPGARISSC